MLSYDPNSNPNHNHNHNSLNLKLPSIKFQKPRLPLSVIFSQLKSVSKQLLDSSADNKDNNTTTDPEQIKGLKFISAKLGKLFIKNRRLPYNEISKILIDNFASEHRDERNIKRRVYDAINVLVASDILIKKNSYVELGTRNRLKVKRSDKREKIEEDLRDIKARVATKRQKVQLLMKKKKIIEKIFNRNKQQYHTQQQQRKRLKQEQSTNINAPEIFISHHHHLNNNQTTKPQFLKYFTTTNNNKNSNVFIEISLANNIVGKEKKVQPQIKANQKQHQQQHIEGQQLQKQMNSISTSNKIMSFVDIAVEENFKGLLQD